MDILLFPFLLPFSLRSTIPGLQHSRPCLRLVTLYDVDELVYVEVARTLFIFLRGVRIICRNKKCVSI